MRDLTGKESLWAVPCKSILLLFNVLLPWCAAFADAPVITGVTARQRYPWNGKVDISYTVTGDVAAEVRRRGVLPSLKVIAVDLTDNVTNTATAVNGDTALTAGTHKLVWDMDADGLSLKSTNVVFSVVYETRPATYCVVDLSAGSGASSYPVTYLAELPQGGFNVNEYKTMKLALRRIEPGSFKMCGLYDVTLAKPFYMGIFEVTQKQYELVHGSNPSALQGDMRPVECVSWNTIRGDSSTYNWPRSTGVDSSTFVGKLQVRTGLGFDLPTEAQWEYACRAGTTSEYNNGGSSTNDLKQLGRYEGNCSDGNGGYAEHAIVGSYLPNNWGLYDMHGNVWERLLDWFGETLPSHATDPVGPSSGVDSPSGSDRAMRGGSWHGNAVWCSSSHRDCCRPEVGNGYIGVRLARSLSAVANDRVLCTGMSAPVAIDLAQGVRTASIMPMRYCVIDLSAGSNVSSYPVAYLNEPPNGGFNADEYKTAKLVLRRIEPGSFKMCGLYDVTLAKPFYMGIFEVTQKQYELVYGSNPSALKGDTRPVECVSWNTIRGDSSTYDWPNSTSVDPSTFVGRIQSRTGLKLDLPTEAQWEYACRGGTTNVYSTGGSSTNDLKQLGRYSGNKLDGRGGYAEHTTVGAYLPNNWGLYDMHGNVWERLLDWFGETLADGAIDPVGPPSGVDSPSGTDRAARGGSWNGKAAWCSASHRDCCRPEVGNRYYGFRLARVVQAAETEEILPAGGSAYTVAERICYSSEWMDGAPEGAVAVVEANGVELGSGAGDGCIDWTPASNGIYTLTHRILVNGEQVGETLSATVLVQGMKDGYTATQTTVVPVPYVWLWRHVPGIVNEYEAYETAAKSVAANGRKVWECYVLGLDPCMFDDFRITSFKMKPDGTPDLENLTFAPPLEMWNVPDATFKVKGAPAVAGPWQDVPVGGASGLRFFKVEVVLP